MTNLERALGRVAASNADYGAFIALAALRDSLREHGFEAAADHLDDIGERVIAEAFSLAAWSEESQPAGVAAASTNNDSHKGTTP